MKKISANAKNYRNSLSTLIVLSVIGIFITLRGYYTSLYFHSMNFLIPSIIALYFAVFMVFLFKSRSLKEVYDTGYSLIIKNRKQLTEIDYTDIFSLQTCGKKAELILLTSNSLIGNKYSFIIAKEQKFSGYLANLTGIKKLAQDIDKTKAEY